MGCAASSNTAPKDEGPAKLVRRSSKLVLPVVNLHAFLDFCESRMAGENVRFYIAVEAYETLFEKSDQTAIRKAGESIVVQYLSTKSPTEILLDANLKATILQVYSSGAWTSDTFRAARIEVVTTLMDQMMPAFEAICEKSPSLRSVSSKSLRISDRSLRLSDRDLRVSDRSLLAWNPEKS
jgi:Regulator of G protein signaling domain